MDSTIGGNPWPPTSASKVGTDRVILGPVGRRRLQRGGGARARRADRQAAGLRVRQPRACCARASPKQVEDVFTKQFDVDFIHVHAEERYAQLLGGRHRPRSRSAASSATQFWEEFFAVAEEVAGDGEPVKFLAQGTIYPDIIESGARKTGGKASNHQEPPQPDPVPRGRALRPDRAARPLLQGRGPRARHGAGAARPHRASPALPRARVLPSASSAR